MSYTTDDTNFYHGHAGQHLGEALMGAYDVAKALKEPVLVSIDGVELHVSHRSKHLDLLNQYCDERQFTDAEYEEFFQDYYGSPKGRAAAKAFGEPAYKGDAIEQYASKKQDQRIAAISHEGKIDQLGKTPNK